MPRNPLIPPFVKGGIKGVSNPKGAAAACSLSTKTRTRRGRTKTVSPGRRSSLQKRSALIAASNVSAVSSRSQLEAHDRAEPAHVQHRGGEARVVPAVAGHVEIVVADVADRRRGGGPGVLGDVDLHVADAQAPVVHAPAEEVDAAEKIQHERA